MQVEPNSGALSRLEWDHLHFYVGNAKQAAHYYATAFGFTLIAYAGPETGMRDRASYVLEQDRLRFVLTSPLGSDGEIADFVRIHGDGVHDVALRVPNAKAALAAAAEGGARVVAEPSELADDDGTVGLATIATYGDTVHTFVAREAYHGLFLPGYVAASSIARAPNRGRLSHIDHVVGNVGWNEMDRWCDYYARVFGFTQLVSFDDKDISTEFTALRSKVMSDAERRVKFPINEPAEGKKRSQIEEYLDFWKGAGVQHVAIATDDIIATVKNLRANGVAFLEAPPAYYDALPSRIGPIAEAIAELKDLGILVDRDDLGYMLQIFTKPLQDRPTLFFEIIQRKGSLSFGRGNFKALFVAIEEEQGKRGTL
ncbi:MAG: 4-hydroxyphenylpyruvate dioxygenase [Candidatus Baltobacteraceae bacterium]